MDQEELIALKELAARHRERTGGYSKPQAEPEPPPIVVTPNGKVVAHETKDELCPMCNVAPALNVVAAGGHRFPTPCRPCWTEKRHNESQHVHDPQPMRLRLALSREAFDAGWMRLEIRWPHFLKKPNRVELKNEYFQMLRKRMTDREFEAVVASVLFSADRFPRPAGFIEVRNRMDKERV